MAFSLDEVARVIRDEQPDVLLLQEVDEGAKPSHYQDQLALLQERLAAKQLPAAEYTVRTTGPDHDLTFYVDVLVDGVVKGSGTGATKKEAEMHAAHQAHTALA